MILYISEQNIYNEHTILCYIFVTKEYNIIIGS
jgi:hypothetical protein